MQDLISRQAAIEAMGKAQWAKERLMELPSAQPEIIRCKDCIHWHRKNDLQYCDRIDYGYGYEPDDFCSRAERRTDG